MLSLTGTTERQEQQEGEIMMNPEIKAQWVTALRDPEARQCDGKLTRVAADGTESNCCLGVLTELAVKAGVTVRLGDTDNTGRIAYADDGGNQERLTAPLLVQRWAELSDENPRVEYGGNSFALAELNDGTESRRALTFPEIADLIDAQL